MTGMSKLSQAGPGRRGRLSALSVFLYKSVFYGAFVWARRALNKQKRRLLARAVAENRADEASAAAEGGDDEIPSAAALGT